MSHSSAHAAAADSVMDPHGEDGHAHTVVDWRILVGVLVSLLILTTLTVSAYNFEHWISTEFAVEVPSWINVAVALGIAAMKSSLVCLFFMQLRYDKPLHAVIFLFCLLTLSIFLGLSSLDLGTRSWVFPEEAHVIQAGGKGQLVGRTGGSARLGPRPDTGGMSLIDYAREKYKAEYGEEQWEIENAKAELEYGFVEEHGPELSTPEQTVPRRGLTPGLYDETAPPPDLLSEAGHEPAEDVSPSEAEGAGQP